ncbi:MAG: cupredoxin domain-containing protein [Gemmatimonadaceae bacterium]
MSALHLDAMQFAVLAAGTLLIVLILWYFFGERERTVVASGAGGVQELTITVKGGYSPDLIVVKQGRSVKLNFYRDETASCSEEVIFGDFGIARQLPAFKTTAIEFTPDKVGEFTFTCGMNMLRGKLVVEPG